MKSGSHRRLLRVFASALTWAATGCSTPPPDVPAPVAQPAHDARAPRLLETPAFLLQEIPASAAQLALDPRGELLAMATEAVVVVRPRDGAVVARFAPFENVVSSLRFAEDGATLLAVTRGGEVRLWDVERDQLLLDTRLGKPSPQEAVEPEVSIGQGATYAVVADREKFMVVDLRTGEKHVEGDIRPGGTTVRVEGGFASVASADGFVAVRRLADGATLGRVDLGGCRMHHPARDGAHVLVSMCPDQKTKLLHVASKRAVWSRKQVVTSSDLGVAVAERDVVALAGSDLFDVARDRVIARDVAKLALSEDGRLAIVHRDGRAELGRLGENGLQPTVALGDVGRAVRTIAFRGRTLQIATTSTLAAFDVESGRPLGRFDAKDALDATYEPASSAAVWVTCTKDTNDPCASLRVVRVAPGGTSTWERTKAARKHVLLTTGSTGALVSCPTGGALLFEPAGVSVVDPKIAPAGRLPWTATTSPDGRVVAYGTDAGVTLWTRASGDLRPVRTPTPVEGEPPPAITWHPGGRSFVVHRWRQLQSGPGALESAFLHVDGAEVPVELRPLHAWASVRFHPKEPIVFLNSGYGAAYNLMYWAGSDVSVFGFDGRSLARLAGHTADPGRTGRFIAVLRGHPSRSEEGASTQLLDGRTRRPLLRLAGHPVAWGDDDAWVVMRTSPHATINAPAGPDTYTLYELPAGVKRGTVSTEGSASVGPSTAVTTVIGEREGKLRLSRVDLRTGAAVGEDEPLDETDPRTSAPWAAPLEIEPTPTGARVKNRVTGRTIDLHVRADGEARGCRGLIEDPRGGAEGDVASFFRVRRHGDLRSAPLEVPAGATMPKTRVGILRDLVGR